MNILIFSWRDIKNPQVGGSEVYFHEMAKRWAKKGNKVSWIVGGWKGCIKNEIIDGMEVRRVGNEMSLYALAPLEYFMLKDKPDVVLDVSNGIPFFTPLFSWRKKALHIHHPHREVWFKEVYPKGGKYKAIALACWFLENQVAPWIYKNVPAITLCESSAEEILADKLISKYPAIVNPGINFPAYKKFSKNKKPAILFLNRIKKYKGLDVLLEAASLLKEKGEKDLEVWVAGDGDFLGEMKDYAKEKNLDNVKFLGRVSEEKKREIMQKAWVFINPSFKEGWGIVNIESNYFGTPVIGSKVGGIKDSVQDGKTGLLFEYGNSKELAEKIICLIKNKKSLDKMSKDSRKHALKFAWDKKAEEYLKILKRISRVSA